MKFTPRLTKPEAGNPFYNTKSNGGYSTAIKGSPTDSGCNVLGNCVGYALGRFNEISNNTKMTLLAPRNAEVFWDIAEQQGLKRGTTPKLGAVIVWQRGATRNPDGKDGAGHVAIVEQIISENEIVTSESGYGDRRIFWTSHRKNTNGNWGMSANYKFIGFIYHPDLEEESEQVTQLVKLENGTQVYDCSGKSPVIKKNVVVSPTGVYTIVEKKKYQTNGYEQEFGKLKSGIGWVLLKATLIGYQLGDTGEGVHHMKTLLVEYGYLPESCNDDVFDRFTMCALCGFQLDEGLKITGTYTKETKAKLEDGA